MRAEDGNTDEKGMLIGGKYLVTGLIGKGSAGCVYQADDLHLGKKDSSQGSADAGQGGTEGTAR
jgi:hypothetical protein